MSVTEYKTRSFLLDVSPFYSVTSTSVLSAVYWILFFMVIVLAACATRKEAADWFMGLSTPCSSMLIGSDLHDNDITWKGFPH